MNNLATNYVFGSDAKVMPNTFIGGVASTLSAPALVAAKLGISENRISGFRIVGADIEFRVTGSYNTMSAFGSDIIESVSNPEVTYYIDSDGLCTRLPIYAFFNCIYFREFKFSSNLTIIGNGAFSNTAVVEADLSYLISSATLSGNNTFRYCTQLLHADFGEITAASGEMLRGTTNLISCINKFSGLGATFRDSGIVEYSNSYNIVVGQFAFSHDCKAQHITLQNATHIRGFVFRYGNSTNRPLKTLIAPKVVQLGFEGNYTMQNNTTLELVDIRACTDISDWNNEFNNCFKTDGTAVLKVHQNLATIDSGNPHPRLLYCKNIRNVTVELYDDNGNYVSNL